MQVGQFPAAAANSLIQGYCDDFVSLAAILAQTLEQVSMRGLNFDGSRPALQRIESGMRSLAEAIQELLDRGKVSGDLSASLAEKPPPATNANATNATRTAAPRTAGPAAAPARPASTPPASNPSATRPPAPRAAAPAPTPASASATNAPRPAAPRAAAEGLKGTSQSMPLLSVFQFLGRMRKAGTMRVSLGNENLTFDLQNGCVIATTSTQCPREELLGNLLVQLGTCSADDLDPIVVRVGTGSNERFGQAAIDAGTVTEAQVLAALGEQSNRRYARACKHPDTKYEFVEGLRAPASSRFQPAPFAIA